MRHTMAMTKNMRRFMNAVEELMNRPQGTEGMGLLWGEPGEGKSTALAFVVNAKSGVFVRAVSSWTVTTMLGKIAEELGGHRMLRRADMIDFIVQKLAENPRPIFVDEADYLFKQLEMVDSLRDIYDMSGCPVILCGMEEIGRRIQAHARFARRVTQWIEFEGIDLQDARTLADTICEVAISDDLLRHLHKEARGNIGRMVIGLTKIERMAKANGLDEVDFDQWAERPLFYDQPVFSARSKSNGGR